MEISLLERRPLYWNMNVSQIILHLNNCGYSIYAMMIFDRFAHKWAFVKVITNG